MSILLNDGFNLLSIQKTSHFYKFEFINCYIHSLKSGEIIGLEKRNQCEASKIFQDFITRANSRQFQIKLLFNSSIYKIVSKFRTNIFLIFYDMSKIKNNCWDVN